MLKPHLILLFPLLLISPASMAVEAKEIDPRLFGAIGDGVKDDAPALQAAFDACPKGGMVRLPKGRWFVQSQSLRLGSDVTLQGAGAKSVIIRGQNLAAAIEATNASNVMLANLQFQVEPTTPAKIKGRLAQFRHCRDVVVRDCIFDGTVKDGLPSQFSLCLFDRCNVIKCLDNLFRNTAGSATGLTGAAWDTEWGRSAEFARNVIEDYCDTGIGLWTGAREAHVHHNRLRARSVKFTSCPVGIDVDGGTHSLIEHNEIEDGHIAIRLFDCHGGAYPIKSLVVRDNFLHDQRAYDALHPAWAIKAENPKSLLEARFERNRIVQTDPQAAAFVGGGAGRTVLHMDHNDFTGMRLWSFGFYKEGALTLLSENQPLNWRTSVGNNRWKKP